MRLGKLIYLIVLILCCICCNDYNKLKKEIFALQSEPIQIPEYDNEFINKNNIEFGNGKFKYIIFVDSITCSPCFIEHLNLWMKYIYDTQNRIDFYFILSTKANIKEVIIQNINSSPFNYPIILDDSNKFIYLNPHLPKNSQLHTFLLDENNKVILVGDPLENKKIEKLFYKVVYDK